MVDINLIMEEDAGGQVTFDLVARGHAGCGAWGQDIVCAAVSVLLETAAEVLLSDGEAGEARVLCLKRAPGDYRLRGVILQPERAWLSLPMLRAGLNMLAKAYPHAVRLNSQWRPDGIDGT